MMSDLHKFIFSTSFFILIFFFSIVFNKILLKFASNLGIRNDSDIIRWATTTKPSLGGITFFFAFLFSTSVYSIFFGYENVILKSTGIIAACSLGFLMGLADDAYNTKPWIKFAVQLLCALVLIATGTYIELFPPNYQIFNYSLTIFWIVGIMNSINMLDNMDGITSTVSVFIIIGIITVMLSNSNADISDINLLISLGILATLLGFLYYNWTPAKMYMGDSGSQFLGIFLGSLAIVYFWNFKNIEGTVCQTKQIVITLLAFIIPISDTATVTINRLAKGSSPFVGGKDHTTHHLSYLGLSDRNIAILYGGICLISIILIYIIINFVNEWSLLYSFLFGLYFLLIFGALFINTKISKPK